MSTSKNRKKNAAATAEPKPTKKARKSRAGLGMNNTWIDEPPVAETAAPEQKAAPETATVEGPAADAVPAEPAVTAAEPVAPEPRPAPTVEVDVPGKKLSAIDAAAKVLGEEGRPMTCQEMIDAMAAKGYWQSPGGKTPAATLYSSILREQKVRGAQARFVKAERGRFTRAH